MSRPAIYQEIEAGRIADDAQWGGPAHDDEHSWMHWASFVGYQLKRLNENPAEVRDRMLKVARLAVAAIESTDRRNA